jgi:hypothetical protein
LPFTSLDSLNEGKFKVPSSHLTAKPEDYESFIMLGEKSYSEATIKVKKKELR